MVMPLTGGASRRAALPTEFPTDVSATIPVVTITPFNAAVSSGLEVSGPVSFSANGQTIENKEITSTSGNAVTCDGFNDCILQNCKVLHEEGRGVDVKGASLRFAMTDVGVVHTNPPVTGAHTTLGSDDHLNVRISGGSHDFVATRIRVTSGSGGFYVVDSDRALLTNIEGHDHRGPIPRGQLVQFNKSDDCILQDFSEENDRTKAWTEDNVNIFGSDNAIIRRGLLDGNNSPSGVGLLAEPGGVDGSNALFEDVDCINQGNGGFANVDMVVGSGSFGVTMRRCRVRGMVNTSWQSRGFPSSSNGNTTSGLHYRSTSAGATGETFMELCKYWYVASENNDLPLNLTWQGADFTYATDIGTDRASNDFTPRSAQSLTFPWE